MLLQKYYAIFDLLGAEAAEREAERLLPERAALLLAAAGAAKVLGNRDDEDESITPKTQRRWWQRRLLYSALPSIAPGHEFAETRDLMVGVTAEALTLARSA